MYGAILGDYVGSRFEFDRPGWTKDFEFITKENNWTDDTVMTIAVAEALISAGKDAEGSEIEKAVVKTMQKWGKKYPGAGYGGRFSRWLTAANPKPYGSFGNGSAMRVSAAGWLYDSLERTREVARATANVTHNHPEGIKGAECTAAVIYLARTGASKEEIADYVSGEFGYDFSETLEEMRARHKMDESCMDALPKALRSFMDGKSLEDTIRNAVSLGGDTDTIAAIAGAMAEGMYGIPVLYKGKVLLFVEDDMRAVLGEFEKAVGRLKEEDITRTEDDEEEDEHIDDDPLSAAYHLFADEEDQYKKNDAFPVFLRELAKRTLEGGTVPVPMVVVEGDLLSGMDPEKINAGDEFTLKEQVRLRMDTMTDPEGKLWMPLFLNMDELEKGETANVRMEVRIMDILKAGLDRDDVEGVVVNPFDKPFVFRKNMLGHFIGNMEYISKREIV